MKNTNPFPKEIIGSMLILLSIASIPVLIISLWSAAVVPTRPWVVPVVFAVFLFSAIQGFRLIFSKKVGK